MCTVSFFYLGNNDFIVTSNRDEAIDRKTAPPQLMRYDDTQIVAPKDEVAHGTWIGVSDKMRMLCLLNGAFKKHKRNPPYKKSRGLLVKELLAVKCIERAVQNYDYSGIEPFTLIIVDWQESLKLLEVVWDGSTPFLKSLPLSEKLWCSATLYNEEMNNIRQQWFVEFCSKNEITKTAILNFHEHYGMGDTDIDLKIDRGPLKTVSITSVCKMGSNITMEYKDLLVGKVYKKELNTNVFINE